MEFQRWCLIFLTGVGFLVVNQGMDWVWTTVNIVLPWTYLVAALIVIALGRNPRSMEEQQPRQEEQRQEEQRPEEQRPAANQRRNILLGRSSAVPYNHLAKRETRPQRDFLATAPSKIPSKARIGEKTAVTEAVRENIKIIEEDLIVSNSSLLDELQIQGYLSEEEVNTMKNRSRKDQTHLFASKLQAFDNKAFLSVLKILEKSSFKHVAEELEASFQKHSTSKLTNSLCSVCRIRSEINIKDLRCNLLKEGFLPQNLYDNINYCQKDKGHQNALWEELFFHLRSLQPKEETLRKFVNFFNTPKHQGLYNHLCKNPRFRYVCTCKARSSMETDSIKPKIPTCDTSDESNTPSMGHRREEEWYQDAVDSASNSESGSRGRKLPKLCNEFRESSKADGRSTKQRFRKGTKKNILVQSRQLYDDGSTTSSFDSNPGRNNFTISQIPPQTKKRGEKRTRQDLERSSNEEFSADTSEVMDSNTELKTIIEPKTSRKTPPVISVRPYIAESDFNSDGEARKHYYFPVNPTFKEYPKDSEFSGDAVPTAFAKTLKSGGTTQLW